MKSFNNIRPLSPDWPICGKRTWNSFPDTLKKPNSLKRSTSCNALDRFALRAISLQSRPIARQRARSAFVGAERDEAQALARERYRRQNDSGFSYQGGKKSFDTLVKEAEQEIIKQKINNSLALQSIG